MTDLSVSKQHAVYKPVRKVRFVTAASLFDGHDASINIMRRIFMAQGCEVVHLGHNRSVQEVVDAAVEEATAALNGAVFEAPGLPEGDVRELTERLTALRTGLGDS